LKREKAASTKPDATGIQGASTIQVRRATQRLHKCAEEGQPASMQSSAPHAQAQGQPLPVRAGLHRLKGPRSAPPQCRRLRASAASPMAPPSASATGHGAWWLPAPACTHTTHALARACVRACVRACMHAPTSQRAAVCACALTCTEGTGTTVHTCTPRADDPSEDDATSSSSERVPWPARGIRPDATRLVGNTPMVRGAGWRPAHHACVRPRSCPARMQLCTCITTAGGALLPRGRPATRARTARLKARVPHTHTGVPAPCGQGHARRACGQAGEPGAVQQVRALHRAGCARHR